MSICTAKASGISRETVKSRCAREWGGWGRISEDGPGQQNPDRSEGPWGRAGSRLHGGAHQRIAPDTDPGIPVAADSTKDGSKPACWEAPSEIPALKPYRGKPAVRNFRGGNVDVGIIRSPVRAIALPDSRRVFTDVPPSQKRWGPRNGVSFPLEGVRRPDAGKGKLTPLPRTDPPTQRPDWRQQ